MLLSTKELKTILNSDYVTNRTSNDIEYDLVEIVGGKRKWYHVSDRDFVNSCKTQHILKDIFDDY